MSEWKLIDSSWRSRRSRGASRRARLNAGLPPYRRQRLRSEAEARFLRRIGTPEPLIGPIGTDEEVAQQRAELIEFARRLREAARRR
jgi:hypothetical protein